MEIIKIIDAFKKGEINAKEARLKLAEACHPAKLKVTPAIAEYIYVTVCDIMNIGYFDFDYEDED